MPPCPSPPRSWRSRSRACVRASPPEPAEARDDRQREALSHEPVHDDACPWAGVNFYQVQFRPQREMFSSGTNPIMLLRNLAALGPVSVCQLHAEDLPPLAKLDPARARSPLDRRVGEFISRRRIARSLRVRGDISPRSPSGGSTSRRSRSTGWRSIAPRRRDASSRSFPPQFRTRKSQPAEERRKSDGRWRSAERRKSRPPRPESSSIRVATEKVDRLIDLVGELVIAQVMTAQMVEDFEPSCLPKLREAVAAMERSTRELHERVMAVRMMPVCTLFQRYVRVVYDIAQSTGKQIRLETDGEETEIDKSMLELLGDPLTHLVRNAADHGIESAEVRLAADKPAEGVIHMRAFHRSGENRHRDLRRRRRH